jgi:hypothetical protein
MIPMKEYKMPSSIFIVQRKTKGPVPVTGAYGECLAEIELACQRLIALVRAERSGTFDGYNVDFWIGSDPLHTTAKHIVNLVDRTRGEMRDAAGG